MKKVLAIALVLVTILGLVACGGGKNTTVTPAPTPGTTDPGTVTDPGADDPDPEVPEEPTEWEGDYETATISDMMKYGVGSTQWDGSLPLVTDGTKMTIGLKTDYRVSDLDNNPLTDWLEEQTGLQLEFEIFAGSSSDIATQLNLRIVGGEPLPDIIRANGFSEEIKAEFVRSGDLVNLAGYFMTDAYYFSEAMALNYTEPSQYTRILNFAMNSASDSESGYTFAFPVIYNQSSATVNTQMLINKKWLDTLGLQMPTTIDELYDVLVAFRDKDPNGNGKKDEIPMAGLTHAIGRGVDSYIINAFIQWSVTNRIQVEDGEIFTVFTEDEYREALKFMNKCVKEGLITELCTSINSTKELTAMYHPADGVSIVGMGAGWITTDWLAEENILEYEAVVPLQDATGRGGYGIFNAANLNTADLITTACEDPRLAFRFLDFMCSAEAFMRHRWGEYGVDWVWIEDSEYADKAKGTGHLGGDAAFVRIGDSSRTNCRWFAVMSFVQEDLYQYYLDPSDTSATGHRLKIFADNVQNQKDAGQPEESFDFWSFQGDEWDTYIESDTNIYNLTSRAMDEFIMGIRDPYSDADWLQFQDELEDLHLTEAWIETAQASFDRQMQGIY